MTRFGPPAGAETVEAARPICGNIELPKAAPNPEASICMDLRRLIMEVATAGSVAWNSRASGMEAPFQSRATGGSRCVFHETDSHRSEEPA